MTGDSGWREREWCSRAVCPQQSNGGRNEPPRLSDCSRMILQSQKDLNQNHGDQFAKRTTVVVSCHRMDGWSSTFSNAKVSNVDWSHTSKSLYWISFVIPKRISSSICFFAPLHFEHFYKWVSILHSQQWRQVVWWCVDSPLMCW